MFQPVSRIHFIGNEICPVQGSLVTTVAKNECYRMIAQTFSDGFLQMSPDGNLVQQHTSQQRV